MANNRYEPELREKVLRLYLEEGRTVKSLIEEYSIGKGTIISWLHQYRKEYENNPIKQKESNTYSEAKKLQEENRGLKKEVAFLIP